ncbi:MAG TPA: GNAT family protein [Micromonosporaceae bacterium]|nr:GNAT family protein [Micromonosporaceae bacterium]
MAHPYWPIVDLRLTVGDLTLCPQTEADLDHLTEVWPPDFEDDPSRPRHPHLDHAAARAVALRQLYWRSVGQWSPEDWRLQLIAFRGGAVVGCQIIRGTDFRRLGTVKTGSWVATPLRGQGIGKAMRLAVLALAFEGLGARYAETSAWQDRAASLGVSRSLGYLPNGAHREPSGDGDDDAEMVYLRMPLEVWQRRHAGHHGVTIENLTPAWYGAERTP